MREIRTYILILVFSSIIIPRAVFAYDDLTTHPALTDEIVDFYNLNFEDKLTDQEKEWLIEGSTLEDTPPRWVNHFYDPVYNQGWVGGDNLPDMLLAPEKPISAKDWAHNQEFQEKYNLYKGNQTWQKAIYEYVKNEDKEKAFLALGYVLHLLEDMAVPEHTRSDTHLGDSPYENYAERFTRESFKEANNFKQQNYQPIILESLDDYFDYSANYSNHYFFSKDTINSGKYNNPKIIEDDGDFAYGKDKSLDMFKLSLVDTKTIKVGDYFKKIKTYSLGGEDFYDPILQSYWNRLAREAVLTGSGTLRLFFEEAERAKNNPDLLEIPPESQSAIVSILKGNFSAAGEAFRVLGVFSSAKNWLAQKFTTSKEIVSDIPAGGPALLTVSSSEQEQEFQIEQLVSADPISPTPPIIPDSPIPPIIPTVEIVEEPVVREVSQQVVQQITEEVRPPSQFLFYAPAGAGGGAVLPNPEPDPEPEEEPLPAEAPEGVEEGDPDSEPELEPEPEPELEPEPEDTIPPELIFSIQECEYSLSPSGCLLTGITVSLFWQSTSTDLDFFELTINGQISTTTATSTIKTLDDNSQNSFSMRAKDKTGNYSNIETITVEISSNPVVINEVAWSGTNSSYSSDEWIEIYNKTSQDIDLENWVLHAESNEPYIQLSGTIQANEYYLLERTDDNTISDIQADLIYGDGGSGWALNNSGEVLILSNASTTVDQTVLCGIGPTKWCPGFSYKYRTMERVEPSADGTEGGNWHYNDQVIKNGRSADDNYVYGTPKARNSVNYHITKNDSNLTSSKTLTKSNSPYFIGKDNQLIVSASATLTIEPGVVIKVNNNAGLNIQGKIIAQGTESDPIIFTSFYDDDYGGDLNNDATSTSPFPGSWRGVIIKDSAQDNSIFDYTIFRYGGKYTTGVPNQHRALLSTEGPIVSVSNSTFEQSKVYGLKLVNSDSQISNNTFQNNNNTLVAGINAALYISGGSPTLQNNTFTNNVRGIYLSNSTATVDSNNFELNSEEVVYSLGSLGIFTNNTGSNNSMGTIQLAGNITQADTSTILGQNDLPYSIDGSPWPTVVASSTLTMGDGIIVKGTDSKLSVEGNLIIDGNDPSDIIFTSLYDDSVGGDSTNDATSTTPQAGQFGGIDISETGTLVASGFTMRYAGDTGWGGNNTGGIFIDGGVAEISEAIFTNNYPHGIRAEDSSSVTIQNARFENHTYDGSWGTKAAVSIQNSTTTLNNIVFENNLIGILGDSISTFITSAISFINNVATTSPSGLF